MASPVKVVRIVLKILSTIAGIFFLCKSSFSHKQFGNWKTFAIAVLSALVVTSNFVVPRLRRKWIAEGQGNKMKLVVKCFFFAVVAMLVFLIKYPRFNIHSEYSRSCVNEQREKMAPGSVFNLLSAAAFSFFSFIISFRREEAGVLGFSSILLGLTIDASIEINANHGPNFLCIGVAASFCVALIFFGGYAESLRGNPGGPEARNGFVQYVQCAEVMELPSAIAAIISLSLCSFSKLQFQNSSNLEVACLSVFSLLLGACMKNLPGWIDIIVQACSNPLRVAAQNSLLLLITSVLIFLNKFPRFYIHSKYREFCTEKEENSINHGSRFDLYSLDAFAFLVSLISSEQPYDERQSFESGFFSFLLELIMDASIETLENKKPNTWYVMFAFMYCVGLIFLKACFPPDQQNDGAGGGGGGGGRGGESLSGTVIGPSRPQRERPTPHDIMGPSSHHNLVGPQRRRPPAQRPRD